MSVFSNVCSKERPTSNYDPAMSDYIVILVNSLTAGGAELQTIRLFNGLHRDRFRYSLLYLKPNEVLKPKIDQEYVGACKCLEARNWLSPRALVSLYREIKTKNAGIVYCVNLYSMMYAILVKLIRPRLKVICSFHTTLLASKKARFQFVFYRMLLKKCDYLIFVCKNQMRYWVEERKLKLKQYSYIYNGVDTTHYQRTMGPQERQEMRKQYGIAADRFVLVTCAALRPEKAHTDLLDAMHRLGQRGREYVWLVVGDGIEMDAIRNKTEELGLDDRVRFVGYQQDVRPFLSIADCMVLPSRAVETFSLAILEALSMGLPVIATDIGGADELVEDGANGYLYPPGDISALVDRLDAIRETNLEAFGRRSRERVAERYDLSSMIDSYHRLFVENA